MHYCLILKGTSTVETAVCVCTGKHDHWNVGHLQRIKLPMRYSNVLSIFIFLSRLYNWVFLKGYLKNVPLKNKEL